MDLHEVALHVPIEAAFAGYGASGGRGGARAWRVGGAAVAIYCHKVARRELPHVMAALLLGLGVLAAGAAAAWQAGADIVKVFPCGMVGGPRYIKSIKGPFPQIELIPSVGLGAVSHKCAAWSIGVWKKLEKIESLR